MIAMPHGPPDQADTTDERTISPRQPQAATTYREGPSEVPDSGQPAPGTERIAWLPPKAKLRARKLILRSQLGLPWLLGALAAALLILVAGALLLVQSGRPGAPWALVGPAGRFPEGTVAQTPLAGSATGDVLVIDRRGGAARGFVAGAGNCDVVADGDGFSRPCQEARWDADGRPPAGSPGQALRPVRVRLAGGGLYVDLGRG
jgi:hypothetical protein